MEQTKERKQYFADAESSESHFVVFTQVNIMKKRLIPQVTTCKRTILCNKHSSYNVPNNTLRSVLFGISLLLSGGAANADIGATHTSLVSEFPSFNTPDVLDGRVESIAIDGDTVFVGGTFSQIQDPLGGEIIDQPYLFAYSKSTGNVIRDFDPVLDNQVFILETTGEGEGIFVGGVFSVVNGEPNNRGLVKLDDNGDRVPGFFAKPNKLVRTMVRLGNKLFIGGNFDIISSVPVENLAALDTVTGAVDANLNLDFDGVISTTRTSGVQGVQDIDITSDGSILVAAGNFLTVDGFSRTRLAVIELNGQARVSDWNTDIYDVQCPARIFPQYIRGIDIAPDDSYFAVGTTGFRIVGNPACDTLNRFDFGDLSDTNVQPTWTNFTGGDTIYDVVSTDHAIYIGGHFRNLNNDASPDGGRTPANGATERAGMAAVDPKNGLTLLNWRSDRNPRGLGTFALIAEPEGLYIGDDTDFMNGTQAAKLKFLPITTNTIQRPEIASLPTTVLSPDGSVLVAQSFDGANFGSSNGLVNNGWDDVRGAVALGGQIFHADSNGMMWRTQIANGTAEPRRPVDLFGLVESDWALSRLGGMFFDHEFGRVYYTIQGDSQLYYRAFTPDGPYFGNDESIATVQADIQWSNVSGMDVIDGYLYFGQTDGNLYRAQIEGAAVLSGTTEIISGPGIDGRNWNNNMLAFATAGDTLEVDSVADFVVESSGSETVDRFQRFQFPVTAGEETVLLLEWDVPSADVDIFIRDANNDFVISDNSQVGSPKILTLPAGPGGFYTAAIQVTTGATAYKLQVNPQELPEIEQPMAEFEFSSSGTPTNGRWQVFSFNVNAGETVEASVLWDDPNGSVSLFLRDETGTQVARDADGGSSIASASTVAQSSGLWSVGIAVREGDVDYNVFVDTLEPTTTSIEFNSNGSTTDGRWQVFRFDVEAGDLIEARVIWDNADGDLNVFLRDENNSQVARDTVGNGSPALTTGIATTSGTWSVGVAIQSGDIDYSVLIDTTSAEAPVVPEITPDISNIALNGVASQSSTAFGGDASRAIDGNTDGRYGRSSVTHTATSDQPLWQVQLNQTSVLDTIVLFNRTDDCCTQRLTNFTVRVLNDNGLVVFSRDFDAAPNPSISIDVGGVSGSTVQVQLRGLSGILSLAEVQVMGYAQ